MTPLTDAIKNVEAALNDCNNSLECHPKCTIGPMGRMTYHDLEQLIQAAKEAERFREAIVSYQISLAFYKASKLHQPPGFDYNANECMQGDAEYKLFEALASKPDNR